MLEMVKKALRIVDTEYDDELNALISSAQLDLGIAGVVLPTELDAIISTAIITYCKLHFSDTIDEALKKSYDEQKAQLTTATGYTDWRVE